MPELKFYAPKLKASSQVILQAKVSSALILVMDEIRVAFKHKGKAYTSYFSVASGMGSDGWKLYIEKNKKNFYYGTLRMVNNEWAFHGNEPDFVELAEYFGQVPTAWYE